MERLHLNLSSRELVALFQALHSDDPWWRTREQMAKMEDECNTITEFYELYVENQRIRGFQRGFVRGFKRSLRREMRCGWLKGKLESRENILREGVIDQAFFNRAAAPLYRKLAALKSPQNASNTPTDA